MRFIKNISVLAVITLLSSVSVDANSIPDSIGDFKKEKQELVITLQNQLEELHSNLSKLEVRIHQNNDDLSVTKEDIVDRNYIRLQAIRSKLEEELKTVSNATEKDWERLREAKITSTNLEEESKMLIRKIEEKLRKNSRKS